MTNIMTKKFTKTFHSLINRKEPHQLCFVANRLRVYGLQFGVFLWKACA